MDSQWLKKQFEHNPHRTKAGLAKALGLEPPAVSKILNGTRQIKAQEYGIMRKYFGFPVEEDTPHENNKQSYVLKPLADIHEKGDGNDNGEWIIPATILSQHGDIQPEKIQIFKIQDNAMEPDYKRGEHVLLDISDQKPSPPGVFVVSDGFGYLVRQCAFVPQSNPPQIKISAKNKAFLPQTLNEKDFKIIGRVIAKLQWI